MNAVEVPNAPDRNELVAIVGVAFAVTFLTGGIRAAFAALWTDELFTLYTSKAPLFEIIQLCWNYRPGIFDHPPLSFLIMHPWIAMVGDSPFVLRLPALICFAFTASWIGWHSRKAGLPRAMALLVAAWCAIHPLAFDLGSMVRMYGFCSVLGCGIASGTLSILREDAGWKGPVMLGASLAALLYTSYFGLLAVTGLSLLATAALVRPALLGLTSRRPAKLLAGGIAAGLLLYTPWIPVILRLLSSEQGDGVEAASLVSRRWVQAVALLHDAGGTWLGVAFLVAGSVLGVVRRPRREVAVIIALAVLPCVLLFALSPPQRPLHIRYLIFAWPGLLAFAAFGWAGIATRFARYGASLLAVSLVAGIWSDWQHRPDRNGDWWAVAAALESQATQSEGIMAGGLLTAEALDYHMKAPENLSFIQNMTQLDPFYEYSRNPSVVWYVNAAPLPEGYARIVQRYFPWRLEVKGNREVGGPILMAAKKPFNVPGVGDAKWHEPEMLEYEPKAP